MKILLAALRARRGSFQTVLALAGASASLLFLAGCATDQPVDRTAMLPEDQRVSTNAWSQPEKWETGGQLGQLATNPRLQNR